jgi:thymidylate synthase (FAD)
VGDILYDSLKAKDREKLIDRVVSSGHLSVIEHVNFTFCISGVSRSLTHQLVRHRIASYSQQSQRYTGRGDSNEKSCSYVIPPTIRKKEGMKEKYQKMMIEIEDFYDYLVDNGIPPEDARYVLPNAYSSNIVVTMNCRSLFNFFQLRCCYLAQWEIRHLAWKMLSICNNELPEVFKHTGPNCRVSECKETVRAKKIKCPLFAKS